MPRKDAAMVASSHHNAAHSRGSVGRLPEHPFVLDEGGRSGRRDRRRLREGEEEGAVLERTE